MNNKKIFYLLIASYFFYIFSSTVEFSPRQLGTQASMNQFGFTFLRFL